MERKQVKTAPTTSMLTRRVGSTIQNLTAPISEDTLPGASLTLPTLLLVDDDAEVRNALTLIFESTYQLVTASTGMIALEVARRRQIDIALVDIRMPGLSGIQVLEQLKKIDPCTEVLVLTGHETIETSQQALRLGAFDYIAKPFALQALAETVAAAAASSVNARNGREQIDRLERLQNEVQQRQMREEVSRTRSEIYASILHDINGPLTVVAGLIEVVNRDMQSNGPLKKDVEAALRENTATIARHVGNCVEISRRYMSFLHGASSPREQARLSDVLAELKDMINASPQARSHTLFVCRVSPQIRVAINPTDLLQVLLNLTMNALQAGIDPHRVEICCETGVTNPALLQTSEEHSRWLAPSRPTHEPNWLAISVQDNGPGMPTDLLDTVFEPFVTTRVSSGGTGLGLAIVRRLTLQAGGFIHLTSQLGVGTGFTIYLPLITDEKLVT